MRSSVWQKLLLTAAVAATLSGSGHWMQPSGAVASSASLLPVELAASSPGDGQAALAAHALGLGFMVAQTAPLVSGGQSAAEFTFPSNGVICTVA